MIYSLNNTKISQQELQKINFQSRQKAIICIVDNFSGDKISLGRNKFLDKAGSDKGKIPHGTLMFMQMRKELNKTFKIICENCFKPLTTETETEELAKGIKKAVTKIKKFKKMPMVINLSKASTYKFSEFSNIINILNNESLVKELDTKGEILTIDAISQIARKEKSNAINIDANNIDTFREKIYTFLENLKMPQNCKDNDIRKKLKEDFKVVESLKHAIDNGITVFNSAGNDGKKYFNLYNIPKGIISVGAYDLNGDIAQLSCNNSLVTTFNNGAMLVSPVIEHNNIVAALINGNFILKSKKPVPASNLELLAPYVNKTLSEVRASDKDLRDLTSIFNEANFFAHKINAPLGEIIGKLSKNERISRLNKLFTIDELADVYNLSDKQKMSLKSKGDLTTASLNIFFKEDANHKILPTVIDDLIGTSGACVAAAANYLKSIIKAEK